MNGDTAILTLVRNEPFFLPRWLDYYGRTGASLFVLDHESDDGSTSNLPLRVVLSRVTHPECEPARWMLQTVQDRMRELLKWYARVIYAEVDEFLIPDPARWASLGAFLAENRGEFVGAQGWNVIHRPGDLSVQAVGSLLMGRTWVRSPVYDMTLVARTVPNWKVGRHGMEDRPNDPDAGLRLVHLHYIDPELGWQRILARKRGRAFAQDGCGFQNKYENRSDFDAHWGEICGAPGAEPVPAEYWGIL